MNTRLTLLATLLTVLPLGAQDAAQNAGLTSAFDIRKLLASLAEQTQRLQPVLDELTPQDWIAKGASSAYVDQWKQAKDETGYVIQNTKELSTNPETMTAALNLFLRLQNLEAVLNSLGDGVRRYQAAGEAEVLRSVVAANSENRQRLRDYLVELVSNKEAEMKIMSEEARRCRDMLIRQPAPAKR